MCKSQQALDSGVTSYHGIYSTACTESSDNRLREWYNDFDKRGKEWIIFQITDDIVGLLLERKFEGNANEFEENALKAFKCLKALHQLNMQNNQVNLDNALKQLWHAHDTFLLNSYVNINKGMVFAGLPRY